MKVAILHPWFPQYRKAFFDRLIKIAAEKGVAIDVFYGSPPPEWRERGDSISEEYAFPLPTRFIKVGKRNLIFKSPALIWKRGPYDLIILEQAVRNLEAYILVLRNQGAQIAFWGHGRTYTERVGRLQEKLKLLLTKRGAWFFAYTDGGAAAVISAGFPAEHVSVVQNSVDTASLIAALAQVSTEDREEFSVQHDLQGKTGLFIGGLDSSKRLEFLLAAAELAYAEDPQFRLLVAGSGSEAEFIKSMAATRSWMSYLGPLFGADKATAIAVSQVFLMPGRVGLVAVDSFASGRPIITTKWDLHAPEFEYLSDGQDAIITADEEIAYANAIVATLNDSEELKRLQENARSSASIYTVSRMADNFLTGLMKLAIYGSK